MDNSVTSEQIEPLRPETPSEGLVVEQHDQLAAWLQFPRRIILLLVAFGLGSALLVALRRLLYGVVAAPPILESEVDWSISWTTNMPVAMMVSEQMSNTLFLLEATLLLTIILALAAILVAVLVHKLEEKAGPVGSILKALGRLWIFSNAAAPVFVTAMLLIFIFAIQLEIFPAFGKGSAGGPNGLGERIRYLLLPALTLSLLPAALTAQVVTRSVTLPRQQTGLRFWLARVAGGLGVLLGQIGGLLSGIVLVEVVFAWPGIGRLLIQAVTSRDLPVLLGVLSASISLILGGRLAAEFFRWLERLLSASDLSAQLLQTPWRRTARIVWVVAALALLLIPLGLIIAGLAADPQATLATNLQARNLPPSSDYPWGTDSLGRDLQTRVLRGVLVTVGPAFLAAVVILIPGSLLGAATGWLTSRRRLWSESVADLILLPADVLLFIPAVPGVIVLSTVLGQTGLLTIALAVALVLLPRAMRVYQALWISAPEQRIKVVRGLVGPGALLLGMLFAGFGLVAAVDFLGLGTPPPIPTLGGVLRDTMTTLAIYPAGGVAPAIMLWVASLAFYIATDALIGFFQSKEALARLNE